MQTENTEGRAYQNCFAVSFVLFLVATAVTAVQYKIPTIMVPIMNQFGIDAFTASWLMSIFTFVGIACAVPVGMLARRFGPRRMILAAVVLVCAASVAGAWAPSVELLLATRALEGVSLVCIIACGPLVIQLCVDPRRTGVASGIWMLGGMLGATIAGILTPLLYSAVGFQGLWLVDAAFAAASGILFALVVKVPDPADAPAAGALSETEAGGSPARGLRSEYRVFLKPNTWLFFIPFAIFQILLLSVLTYAPTSLQQQGMDASLSGFVSTLPMLLAIISSVAFGAISDALHRSKPLYLVGILAMALCTPLLLAGTGPLLWVGVFAMGLLAMGMPTIVIAAYPGILGRPELLTVGMGVLLLVQSLGQFLGSLVPALLLGPGISNWGLCSIALFALGLAGAASVILCKFR